MSNIKNFNINNVQTYLQFELQLSAVARFLTRDGDLASQLQGHGAIQDAYEEAP